MAALGNELVVPAPDRKGQNLIDSQRPLEDQSHQ
jgi:hypothetical protein